MIPKPPDEYSPEEIAQRRDAGLLRALNMPPKPHSELVGKGKRASAKGKSRVSKTTRPKG